MRSSTLVLAASLLTACFSPEVDPNATGEGSDSESGSSTVSGTGGPSGEATESSTTADATGTSTDPDGTAGDTQTNTTDPNDTAPIVEAFTVNGSTRPAEVDEGGTISLEADASDDVGVVGVEFFDGEESLGVVESAPFELDVAVSSADSGSHTYRAVATDTVGQTGESQEVVLSINIVGGVIEILREDLFRGSDFLAFVNGGLDAAMDGRVFLNGVLEGGGASRVMAFNDDLSQIWSQLFPAQTPGRPVSLEGVVVVGGADRDALTLVYRSLSAETGEPISNLVLETDADISGDLIGAGRLARSGSRVVVNQSLQHLAAYDVGLSRQAWLANMGLQSDLAEAGEFTFAAFANGDGCATGTDVCVRRYGPDGQADWTSGLPINYSGMLAPQPDGGAFAVVGSQTSGYELFRIQTNGAAESVATLATDAPQYVSAARADGTGGLVVSGATGEYGTGRAFVTRISADGSIVWDQRQFFNGGVESAALDVEVDGASVFVFGLANNASDFLSFSGDAWVSRVSL